MKPVATIVFLTLSLGTNACRAEQQSFRDRASAKIALSAAEVGDDAKAEVTFGKEVAVRILGRYPLYDDPALTRYVSLVGKAVALHSDRPELEFHFGVLDTDSVNAYAAPGGYIFITKGTLKQMRDEAELAAVLAHEIAHVSRKHIVNELHIKGGENSLEAGLVHLIAGVSNPTRSAFSQTVDQAVELLFGSGLKHEDELEADRVGTLLLANTGYDPTALRSYLNRIRPMQGELMKSLHATHPSFEKRLSDIDKLIAEEKLHTANGPRGTRRFAEHVH
jgi:predicted Zn-dependent protease